MKLTDFDYELPDELIAQEPPQERGNSRLMLLNKNNGEIEHKVFQDLPRLLERGDVLVLNDSEVIPARLFGKRKDTGAVIEVVLLKEASPCHWECLVRPGKKVKPGHVIEFGDGQLRAEVVSLTEYGGRILEFSADKDTFFSILNDLGEMPLPPYITKKLDEPDRYQTVYAKKKGSAAAPTAGLHFTDKILCQLKEKDVSICSITLHVGLGTFRPVKSDNIEEHVMHAEYFEIPENTSQIICSAMKAQRRIIAVGTTCVRTLESAAESLLKGTSAKGWTEIFIYPGYQFKTVSAMITNFHLPKSTLIMMVSAFAGREHVMEAYRQAVLNRYRFFSFGDAMLIHGNTGEGND